MFVDEKAVGEKPAVQIGTLKLSEAIRIGKPLVGRESINFTFCALGCAFAGVHGRLMTPDDTLKFLRGTGTVAYKLARYLGFDGDVGNTVNHMHCRGIPALQIAAELEAKGL